MSPIGWANDESSRCLYRLVCDAVFTICNLQVHTLCWPVMTASSPIITIQTFDFDSRLILHYMNNNNISHLNYICYFLKASQDSLSLSLPPYPRLVWVYNIRNGSHRKSKFFSPSKLLIKHNISIDSAIGISASDKKTFSPFLCKIREQILQNKKLSTEIISPLQ